MTQTQFNEFTHAAYEPPMRVRCHEVGIGTDLAMSEQIMFTRLHLHAPSVFLAVRQCHRDTHMPHSHSHHVP